MKKVILLAVLSSLALSGCQALLDDYRATHPEPVLADPFGPTCDESCRAKLNAYMEAESKKIQTRMPQPYDPYEYQVEINGKVVTCRTGLNTGSIDGINHNVECK